jgi:hypothetical protein
MPWPPHPPRKYADLTPQEARCAKALVPYQWRRRQSGSPEGLSKSRKEQLAAVDLMRHSLDDRVRTRCLEVIISYGLGRLREAPVAAETVQVTPTQVNVHFVAATAPPESRADHRYDARAISCRPGASGPASGFRPDRRRVGTRDCQTCRGDRRSHARRWPRR